MKLILIILTIAMAGCGSLVLQKRCFPVVDHQEYYMCSKLGWFE